MAFEECCICLEFLENDLSFFTCGHCIHWSCHQKLPNPNICPICQTKHFDENDINKPLLISPLNVKKGKKVIDIDVNCCCVIC